MKLSKEQLFEKLEMLGLVRLEKNSRFSFYKPVSYSAFKNRASIHRYGKSSKYKIVFIGQPKQNLFGFYVSYDVDSQAMKEAYEMFVNLVKGNMADYLRDDVQWGNCGIPLVYQNIRQTSL
jgi:hypothetical protein